jgi:hypothetical protein
VSYDEEDTRIELGPFMTPKLLSVGGSREHMHVI